MITMKAKSKEQLNVKVSKQTLEHLDKLINYDDINNRSDAVAHAAKIAVELKEKQS